MLRNSLFLLPLLPILAACSPSITTDLKLSDIVEVGQTDKPRWASAALRIPLPDGVNCEALISGYVTRLAEIMPATDGTCDMTPGAAYAQVDTSVALIPIESERPEKAGLVIEVGALHDDHPLYELTVLSRVTLAEIEKQLGLDTKASDPKIRFLIENDMGREVAMQFSGVFFNDWGAMAQQGILVPDTEINLVQLSDVVTSVIAKGNGDMFMTIYDLNAPAETEK